MSLFLGARVEGRRTRFGAYATTTEVCSVCLHGRDGERLAVHPMAARGEGFFEAELTEAGHGTLYKFLLGDRELPDPYARFLPRGVHGPAMVVEPRHLFRHPGVDRPLREQAIYELHVGTFTREGTYVAAEARLADLAALGVTTIELMPLSSFPGTRGWGYDGVAHFAPFAPYGTPEELARFVDEAHGLGLAVILDAVYNHLGPSGNYLAAYSPDYFTSEAENPWGDAPNFAHAAMRRYVLDNVRYWLEDFRFDGLRLDAVHAIVDPSTPHVLEELARRVRAIVPGKVLIGEDDRNRIEIVTETGLHGVWADDLHHQVAVTLTGERDGYYAAYEPGASGVARAIERGWLYEGQVYPPTGEARGAPADGLAAEELVYCIENHDQVGNRALGERLSSRVPAPAYRAVSMLLLLLPMTPLLFMGQEWAATSPFRFFTDHDPELGKAVSEGRRKEFGKFEAFSDPARRARIPDPQAPETFAASKLDWAERSRPPHAEVLALYHELLALRRTDPVLRQATRADVRAEARGDVLVVRISSRVLVVNLSAEPASLPDLSAGHALIMASGPIVEDGVVPPWTALLLGVDGGKAAKDPA